MPNQPCTVPMKQEKKGQRLAKNMLQGKDNIKTRKRKEIKRRKKEKEKAVCEITANEEMTFQLNSTWSLLMRTVKFWLLRFWVVSE